MRQKLTKTYGKEKEEGDQQYHRSGIERSGNGHRQHCDGILPEGDNCKDPHSDTQYWAGCTGDRRLPVRRMVRFLDWKG